MNCITACFSSPKVVQKGPANGTAAPANSIPKVTSQPVSEDKFKMGSASLVTRPLEEGDYHKGEE